MTISRKKDEKINKLNEWREEKERLATTFFDNEHSIKEIKVSRGDIYNCYLGENIGHEQCKSRPVLIISSDFFNDRTSTVTVAPLSTTIVTKEIKKGGRPRRVLRFRTQYRLHQSKFNYLTEDSVVKLDQLKTVCKSRLLDKLGCLDERTQSDINKKVIEYLDLKM
ncbi:type II toxin-antitoxin system PemK/MazF family toxin [Bacillus cereus]|uniref:type II toxin-antitoxin system PemK/MazF family toxin n=1 Tax=Bacillus thuringiensis TaxID=1428 RepID=UPI003458F45D|nr:type II toxin-antitoxin system PemK/MazF family toxin [Bacillus cereus]